MSPIEILVGPRNCGKSSEAKRMAKDLFEKENIVILDGKELNLDNPFVWGACTHHTK